MSRLRTLVSKIDPGPDGPPGRREIRILIGIVLVGLFVRFAYAVSLANIPITGDAPGFVAAADLFADGHPFWGNLPYGVDHATAWKAPGYPAWLGLIYSTIGPSVTKAALIQAVVCGIPVMVLTWLLARRLFNRYIAIAAAVLIAIYPNAYQWEEGLYVEALVLPLTLLFLLFALRGPPTKGWAVGIGALFGVLMLVRPSSFYLVVGLLAAWWVMSGFRVAVGHVALVVACGVLVIVPWTIRNAVVLDGFIPISLQDMAVAGTFNDDSANDPKYPYAWRPLATRDEDVFDPDNPLPEPEIRSELISRARDFIADHPDAVPKAIFWNGITRLWDIRNPNLVLDEARFEGRRRSVAAVGLAMYYILAPLALFGLWRIRNVRRAFFATVVGLVVAGIFVFAVAAHTRYRVGYEPLIVILACAGVLPALFPKMGFNGAERSEPEPEPEPERAPEPAPAG